MSRTHKFGRVMVMVLLTAVTVLSACDLGTTATPTAVAPTSTDTPTSQAIDTPVSRPADTATVAAMPTATQAVEVGKLKEVPRNRTLIDLQNGPENKWADYDNWNPYSVGAQAGYGQNIMFEPLAYYSAFADKEILWLAESYEYSSDYKSLTIKIRPNINWSDGKPFTAEDVAYTLTTLKELGPKVQWGSDVKQYVAEAVATNPTTVEIKFNVPAPRFFFFMSFKFDIGIYIVPKHIFQDQDWTSFKNYDLAKGWPVTTGAYQVVLGSPEQKVWDRRAEWWAVEAGLVDAMPGPERLVLLPFGDSDQAAQALLSNQADHGRVSVQNAKVVLDGNAKATTHSGRELPYGYVDWWPMSLFVNTTKPPFDDPDVRWALSYFIDRQQLIDVALNGVGVTSALPMPPYPGLKPYMDSISDLLEKYPTNQFDPAKGAELLTEKGWTKGSDGMWVDSSGNKLTITILSYSFLQSIPPVVSEQLKKQGIDATFAMPPDNFDQLFKGTYQAAIWGHGGSVKDPYETLRLYQASSQAVPGVNAGNYAQWSNPEYDKIVDEMYATPPTDEAKLKELYRKAMEVWLPELPDIQLVQNIHNIIMNETYWTGWPTDENSYVNEHSYALTWPLVIMNLKPTQ
jgi:peptide/nickel transport system substrate-binding protein